MKRISNEEAVEKGDEKRKFDNVLSEVKSEAKMMGHTMKHEFDRVIMKGDVNDRNERSRPRTECMNQIGNEVINGK